MQFNKGTRTIVVIVFLASVISLISITNGINIGLSTSSKVGDAEFLNNFCTLVNDTNHLTYNYNEEVGKWKKGEYDNQTLVTVTDSYLPQYDQLIAKASSLDTPEKFQQALDLYNKSLSSERESNALFRDYIKTGDATLNQTSTNLLSDAYKYESDSFALINPAVNENKILCPLQ